MTAICFSSPREYFMMSIGANIRPTLKNDYEFLPDATRHWNYSKYRKKLDNIARVIIATGGWTPSALVALCEVENDC